MVHAHEAGAPLPAPSLKPPRRVADMITCAALVTGYLALGRLGIYLGVSTPTAFPALLAIGGLVVAAAVCGPVLAFFAVGPNASELLVMLDDQLLGSARAPRLEAGSSEPPRARRPRPAIRIVAIVAAAAASPGMAPGARVCSRGGVWRRGMPRSIARPATDLRLLLELRKPSAFGWRLDASRLAAIPSGPGADAGCCFTGCGTLRIW